MKHSKALTSASASRSGFAAHLKASRGRAIVAVVALLASMLSGAVLAPATATTGITVNFETGDTSGWGLGGAADFGGVTSSETTTVPGGVGAPSGTKSATVTKAFGNAFWAGTSFLLPVSGASNLISASDKTASMLVYSPVAGQVVRMKLEDHANNTHTVETNATALTSVGWQTMTFNFAAQASGTSAWDAGFTYNVASVFFDFTGNDATVVGGTYYFDDVAFPGAVVSTPVVVGSITDTATLVSFEPSDTSGYFLDSFGSASFGPIPASVVGSAPAGGSVGSTKAAELIKSAGDQVWAGVTILFDTSTGRTLLTETHSVVTMNAYVPTAGLTVKFKFEGSGAPVEVDRTSALGWQTFSFDFSSVLNPADKYNKAVVFFDFGNQNAGTFYFDDVAFNGATTPALDSGTSPATLVSFEPSDTSGYNLVGFGSSSFGPISATVVGSAPAGGSVGSTKAAEVVKNAGDQVWAGVTILEDTTTAGRTLVSAAHPIVTMNAYVPTAGLTVKFKFEGSGAPVEVDRTSALGWQTFSFDFSSLLNPADTYNKAVVFFDFGNQNAGTFYFDDVAMMGATTPALDSGPAPSTAILVSFEPSDTSGYALGGSTDFGGTVSSLSATPPANGSSGSTKAGKVIKTSGAAEWAGTTFLNVSGSSAVLADASHKVVTANVYSPVAGRIVRLKLEDAGNGGHSVEADATALTVVGWQRMTFDFNTQATGTAAFNAGYIYNMASLFLSKTVSPVADETYYFDDVAFMGAVTPALVVLHDYPFTVTSATEVTGAYSATVAAKQTAGVHNYATLSAPDAGYTGTIDATHWAYLTISNGSFAATGTNVTVDGARADINADGVISLNVWVPDTKTATVKLVSAVAVNGVVTETTVQTITIAGVIPAAAVVSSGIVSAAKSWTLLRSHWSNWDPAQKTDDKVVLGTSGSDSPAFIEGHLYDTTGETMTGMHVTVATTGPIVVGVNQYESPYASRTGGVNTHRAITTDTITASNAFTVLVSADGTGHGGVGTITISVNGTVIGTKTVTVTGPVTGIKGVVNNPVIAAGPVAGYLSPTGSATTFGKAITFVAADATGSISYAGYEAMTVTTSDTSVATAALASDDYGNRFVALTGLKPGKVDVTITNAAGKAFFVGSVTVVSPVIASIVATPAKTLFAPGESATVTMVAKNADGVTVPDGTYTIASGNWFGSEFFFPTISGVLTFVDGSASVKVYAPNAAGPFQMSLLLNSNAVLSAALQGSTMTAVLTVAPATNTSAAVTALSAAVQSLLAQVARMTATFNATFKLLTSRIKAAYAALAKLKAQAKR